MTDWCLTLGAFRGATRHLPDSTEILFDPDDLWCPLDPVVEVAPCSPDRDRVFVVVKAACSAESDWTEPSLEEPLPAEVSGVVAAFEARQWVHGAGVASDRAFLRVGLADDGKLCDPLLVARLGGQLVDLIVGDDPGAHELARVAFDVGLNPVASTVEDLVYTAANHARFADIGTGPPSWLDEHDGDGGRDGHDLPDEW